MEFGRLLMIQSDVPSNKFTSGQQVRVGPYYSMGGPLESIRNMPMHPIAPLPIVIVGVG